MSEENNEVIVEEIPSKSRTPFTPRWKPGESGNPSGRPKGVMTRVDVRTICDKFQCDPFRILALIANGDHMALDVPQSTMTLSTRLKAATELAAYIAPKLKSIEIQKEDDEETRNVYVVTLPASGRELESQGRDLNSLSPDEIVEGIHERIARDDDEDGENERD